MTLVNKTSGSLTTPFLKLQVLYPVELSAFCYYMYLFLSPTSLKRPYITSWTAVNRFQCIFSRIISKVLTFLLMGTQFFSDPFF